MEGKQSGFHRTIFVFTSNNDNTFRFYNTFLTCNIALKRNFKKHTKFIGPAGRYSCVYFTLASEECSGCVFLAHIYPIMPSTWVNINTKASGHRESAHVFGSNVVSEGVCTQAHCERHWTVRPEQLATI